MPVLAPPPKAGPSTAVGAFDDDDDEEGWQDMPVVRDEFAGGLDEEDRKKFHYVTPEKEPVSTTNATGEIGWDERGREWRDKAVKNEKEYNDYTRLRLNEENDSDEIHLRTKFLFDEDKAMTPLSQMQATKDMLTEAQRVAYVGLCQLVAKEMAATYRGIKHKDIKFMIESLELWSLKIMGRLYYHMELETQEQKMIESLAEHGVQAADLAPALMTTHTVANPEYDPVEGKKQEVQHQLDEEERIRQEEAEAADIAADFDKINAPRTSPLTPTFPSTPTTPGPVPYQTTANVLQKTSPESVPGVSTSLSAADKDVTLDIRWTVLCDLFLILIADSVYDARSRVLLETVAFKLGLGWLDVVKFEQRVTEALEIQESIDKLEQKDVIDGRVKSAKKRRYAMLGLATLGGGLVIGLSAGLLAPVIGAGIAGAFTAVGVSGTSVFLAGTGGAAVITTAGTLTGSGIAARGMARRTQNVKQFDLLPLHNNKRVNCILTVSGFMTSNKDDVRLPFSVLDPVVGDVFSVLWEPDMLGETGSTLKILTSEVLSQVGQTVLQATVMTALMSALQWPILLTKLGYLIDNPWSNALDRAKSAGLVLADVLIQRHLGVRPITLIGFSLGSRVIFYALLELARRKAVGIVQDVFILGATLTASKQNWLSARSVVSGRFVNAYARNDWVLNYLFRATSGGLQSIAGLRPVHDVQGLENVDVTDKIAGHMSYRAFMPLILDQLGFPVSADYFDEPEDPTMTEERIVVREGEDNKKKGWFGRRSSAKKDARDRKHTGLPPGVTLGKPATPTSPLAVEAYKVDEDDLAPTSSTTPLPDSGSSASATANPLGSPPSSPRPSDVSEENDAVPKHAGFDFKAIHEVIANAEPEASMVHAPVALTPRARASLPLPSEPTDRPESVPLSMGSHDLTPEDERSASAGPTRPAAASRNVSAPIFAGPETFGNGGEDDDDDDGDITSALSRPPIPIPGPSATGVGLGINAPGGLASTFGRSVTLDDDTTPPATESSNPFSGASYPYASATNMSRANFGWGSDAADAPSAPAWSSGGGPGFGVSDPFSSASSRLNSDEAGPSLSFGRPGGSLWGSETKAASAMDSAMLSSPFASPPGTASLPEDVLNPFGISYPDLGATTAKNGKNDDDWQPPPLTMKTTDTSSTKSPKAKMNFANASSFNISSNPWG